MDDEFAELNAGNPRWYWWRGVRGEGGSPGRVYARRLRHAPAVVLSSASLRGTQGKVRQWEADNTAWTRGGPDD